MNESPQIELAGAAVAVVGMARSGFAAAELLLAKGAGVRAVDARITPELRDKVNRLRIDLYPQEERSFEGVDLVVISPGVAADDPVLNGLRARGVRVVGEVELAGWYLQGPVIGITGSNGKTTTTALTGHILENAGVPCQVGGNIGRPPTAMVATSRPDGWNVLELSSFQLEVIETFRARVGAVLNVTPDHLDRHYTIENYAAAKARLFINQIPGDFAVLNHDDAITRAYASGTRGEVVWFSSTHEVSPGAYLDGSRILLNAQLLMEAHEVPLRGTHNLENTMAAAAMAQLAGATHAQIRAAVMTFPGVEHRLEFVRERNGVSWYNDSKATNVDAALKAVAAFPGGLWIILGGKDKNSDYTPLAAPLKQKAHAALLIGAAAEKIRAQLSGEVRMIACRTLDAAVQEARARAQPGDTVLLAPACASFDQFDNYEHRGREFKRLVGEL